MKRPNTIIEATAPRCSLSSPTMSTDHPPPPFEPLSSIELTSATDSVIVGVRLYPSRAEVTRRYRLSVKTGLNQVKIGGLPRAFDTRSLR